jgi:hypothetical protein
MTKGNAILSLTYASKHLDGREPVSDPRAFQAPVDEGVFQRISRHGRPKDSGHASGRWNTDIVFEVRIETQLDS